MSGDNAHCESGAPAPGAIRTKLDIYREGLDIIAHMPRRKDDHSFNWLIEKAQQYLEEGVRK